jgi:hypothetical protein
MIAQLVERIANTFAAFAARGPEGSTLALAAVVITIVLTRTRVLRIVGRLAERIEVFKLPGVQVKFKSQQRRNPSKNRTGSRAKSSQFKS